MQAEWRSAQLAVEEGCSLSLPAPPQAKVALDQRLPGQGRVRRYREAGLSHSAVVEKPTAVAVVPVGRSHSESRLAVKWR